MTQKGTIDTIGKHTINVRTSVGDSKRLTAVVTITASGHQIAKKEIATLPDGAFYRVNEKAWFTVAGMLDWVKVVLAPWAAKAPPGIVPLLLLDQFKVHMMALVVDAISGSLLPAARASCSWSTLDITVLQGQDARGVHLVDVATRSQPTHPCNNSPPAVGVDHHPPEEHKRGNYPQHLAEDGVFVLPRYAYCLIDVIL